MYRRLTLKRGALRLRVILGSSGELAEHQLLVSLMTLQFLWWAMPSTPLRVVTESKSQFELTFQLTPVAAWLLRTMRRLHRRFGFEFLVPKIRILRDPDWVAKGKNYPLCFRLYAREVEYQESFVVSQAAEPAAAVHEADHAAHCSGRLPPNQTHLRLVVDNADVIPREPAEVRWDELPFQFNGVCDLRGDGEVTVPMARPTRDSSSTNRPRPRPHRL